MLTRKQHELLLYIYHHLTGHGVSPSFEEMKDALGLRSKSGIHRLVTGLEERGFIRRLPHRARALEVIRLPDDVSQAVARAQGFAPRVIDGDRKTLEPEEALAGAVLSGEAEAAQLPLYGRIAAGTPIEALRDSSNFVDVPTSLLSRGDEHYALEVEGDSMTGAGILDGDTVIIQRTETVETGDIIVALVDNEEVTLKRFRRRDKSIALEPANKTFETRIFPAERVKVQGRLIGLIRTY